MTTQRKHTVTITGSSTITLGDLRWLVAQLAAAPEDHKIHVTYYAGDMRESPQSTLSTEVPDAPVKKPGTMRAPNLSVPQRTQPDSGTWRVTNRYDEEQMEQQNER